ncbi:MAG: response regulator [Thalassotalea sp.]|nr:response regulator [Thalassotalea sp.]
MPIKIIISVLAAICLFVFFPHAVLAQYINKPVSTVSLFALIAIQSVNLHLLWRCYQQTDSRAFKLFWQYLLLTIATVVIGNTSELMSEGLNQSLIRDFASLFAYFFIILAIESALHLTKIPDKKYINGRIPSIFFTLICFCYFVLLSAQFTPELYLSGQSSALFNLLVSGLITYRIVLNIIDSKLSYWRYLFVSLLCASVVLFASNINTFYRLVSRVGEEQTYWCQLLGLFPYVFLAITSLIALRKGKQQKTTAKDIVAEPYILLLMLLPLSIHLLGTEQGLFYIVNAKLQTIIVLSWAVAGSMLIVINTLSRRNSARASRRKINELNRATDDLTSAKKNLQESLINSEFKAIVNASNNAILTTSIDGTILSANPAAVQMFQSLEQELCNTQVSRLFAEKDEMHYFFDFKSNVYSLQRKELGISVECTSLRSDGTEFPAQAELQWADRVDTPLIVITFINLSARKHAEKLALESKDKFIANISHEFRTPLTIINGVIDRYITDHDTNNANEDLTTAKRNGLRLVRMVEQLLELSRLSDNPEFSFNTFRLNTLMTMPIDSFSQLANQSNLTFEYNIPDNLWLECDAQAFEKIIFNLLANAIKYTPKGGNVQVQAYCENDTIFLDIIDSGIGINKSSQATIFERFQRADDVKNQSTFGVGIGLSLVHELVKAHDWRISLASEYGHGSKFTLSIPVAMPVEEEAGLGFSLSENEVNSLLTEQRSATSAQVDHSQQVVLVIEDNLDMQGHIKQIIEQNHHCILAGSGELGLELAQAYVPDLIVCDLMLTGIDGFEVLSELKDNDITAHIPVILLTARSDLESRLQGLNLNADEYLSKPFNQHELLTRIQGLIDNRIRLQKRYVEKYIDGQKAERKIASQQKANSMTEQSTEADTIEEKFLVKLESLIAAHYADQDLDISSLAANMAMSERQLQRKIKVILGTTPNSFIKEFRINKAKELLANGYQVGRIALDVGFSSQTYFGRCFKESTGQTPKQFQQASKQCADD